MIRVIPPNDLLHESNHLVSFNLVLPAPFNVNLCLAAQKLRNSTIKFIGDLEVNVSDDGSCYACIPELAWEKSVAVALQSLGVGPAHFSVYKFVPWISFYKIAHLHDLINL